MPYQNSQTNCSSDSGIDVHMEGEVALKENRSASDLLIWGNSHRQSLDASQPVQFSPPAYDSLGNVFCTSSELLPGSGDFAPKTVGMDSMNMWNNYSMDLDLCGNNGLDYSTNNSMFWLPDTSELVPPSGIPSPPSTTSATYSRINSNSPIWQPHGNLSHEANVELARLDPNSSEVPELELVIATEEAWPLARCNPRIFSGSCPRTAVAHLQTLQNCSKLEDAWTSMNDMISPDCGDDSLSIAPLQTTTRDKIIAFAQSFLLKALMTHQGGLSGQNSGCASGAPVFFTLPPSDVLENLLGNSVRSLTPYYSLVHGTILDPNKLMIDNDTSTLLFLLMMAQGASTVPKAEARYLAAGLTETCRISLFDVIEKNVELSANPIVLKSAFLFVLLAAWGGDSWREYS